MLVGPRQDAINAQALVPGEHSGARLMPRLLKDRRYALPNEVLEDTECIAAFPLLSRWSQEELSDEDYVPIPNREGSPMYLELNGKLVWQAGRRSSLTMPSPDVFKFEVRANDFSGLADSDSGNRRSELVSELSQGEGNGSTVWSSFSLIFGDAPGLAKTTHGIVHQWHSHDLSVGRSPVISVNVAGDGLKIRTCSSAKLYGGNGSGTRHPLNGVFIVHHTSPAPPKGAISNIVLQSTLGERGHLNAWINGEQVVNADTPIGYFTDLRDGTNRSVLGYPQWGLYTRNQAETDIAYIANIEWGTESLASRVVKPLPIPDLNW